MMDFNTRLKALTRLARSATEEAESALERELQQAAQTLESESDYERLAQAIAILEVVGPRFSATAVNSLGSFIGSIESRGVQPSELERELERKMDGYHSSQNLIIRAIDALAGLRYLQTVPVLNVLLELTMHPFEPVRKKAFDVIGTLAGYNIVVFFGVDRKGGIGATPQKMIVEALERMPDLELVKFFQATIILLRGLLSPTMEATSWAYEAATFSRGPTPAVPDVQEVRLRSIRLLERIYGTTNVVTDKQAIIDVLQDATRMHDVAASDNRTIEMMARDSIEVLRFYKQLITREDLQLVQRIESHSYWIFFHAVAEGVRMEALSIERSIAKHQEYQIYRVLIGFEGVFGKWAELVGSQKDFGAIEASRKFAASQYAGDISVENYPEWRGRILRFSKTESGDLATFPVFYYFLEEFAKTHPALALRLITEDRNEIERFLIPVLRGLWTGPERGATRTLVETWIDEASENHGRFLFACMRLFLSNEELDFDLIDRLLKKGAELKDLGTVRQAVSVAITNYRRGNSILLSDLFLPALRILTTEGDASWVFDAWFRRELNDALAELNDDGVGVVLENLLNLPQIDYHAEEVLCAVALRHPASVIGFFGDRLDTEIKSPKISRRKYEAIPFDFSKLQGPLSTVPRAAVQVMRERFERDGPLFQFRGGRFLKNIFPNFPTDFEAELSALVRAGGDANCSFVLGILRNYEGQPFIHNVCRQILRSISIDSSLRTDVAIALEATGVVSGRYGFAEAYEQKRLEVLEWLADPDERVREFAKQYISNLERMRDSEKKRAEEEIALDKFRYGEAE